MTQNALDYSQNPSGADLMDVFLAGMADNQLTNHSGVSRPSYAKAGTFWIDTSASPWTLKQFTGTNDVTVGTLDQTNLYFTASRALGDKNGNDIAATYLTTTGTASRATADASGNLFSTKYVRNDDNAVTFSGTVTFSNSPVVPNVSSATDSSTKSANTAFVQTLVSNKIQEVNSLPVSPVAGVLYVIPES